jgi:hypothetical protein
MMEPIAAAIVFGGLSVSSPDSGRSFLGGFFLAARTSPREEPERAGNV